MPNQTTKYGNLRIPDGCKVSIKESGAGAYTDLGATESDTTATFNWEENEYESGNAGVVLSQIKSMEMGMDFGLINFNPDDIERLGAGAFENVATAAGSVSSIDDQVIPALGASDVTPYNMVITETGGSALKYSSALVIASVTGASDGALTVNVDWTEVDDSNSPSGKSIVFNTAGAALSTMDQVITIAYTSMVPVASTTLYAGSSTQELTAYQLKFTHTNSDSDIDYELEVFAGTPNSGGLAFNFLGAASDGVDVLPLSITGKIDSGLTDGRQLFSWFTKA